MLYNVLCFPPFTSEEDFDYTPATQVLVFSEGVTNVPVTIDITQNEYYDEFEIFYAHLALQSVNDYVTLSPSIAKIDIIEYSGNGYGAVLHQGVICHIYM